MFLSLAVSVFLTVDFYYLKIGGIVLCQNRWTYYVKLVDFFYLKNGGLLLFQNRWTFIHSNPNILFSKLVDFYFQRLQSLFGLWIFYRLPAVFSKQWTFIFSKSVDLNFFTAVDLYFLTAVDFYFLKPLAWIFHS